MPRGGVPKWSRRVQPEELARTVSRQLPSLTDTPRLPRLSPRELSRLLRMIDGDPFGQRCAFWMGGRRSKTQKGAQHGMMSIKRNGRWNALYVHRILYHNFTQDLSETDGIVRHKCPQDSNGSCVTLHHLLVGTYRDNSLDMVSDGNNFVPTPRQLTDDQVRQIRQMLTTRMSYREIGRFFGIGHGSISSIAAGKTYNDV